MLVSGISYPPEGETIPMPTYRFGPYNKEGSVQIQMLVDGTSVELKHNFTVKKPPPPQIGTPSIIDKSTNIYQVEVRYYGRANEIIKFKPRSGIVKGSYNRISSPRVSGNAMVETWTFQVVNPGSSLASQRVKIWVDDKYNNRDEKTISLRYYYE
jgi:hypothetical protein